MVRVTVPATSANMGSGYDSIGIALELYNVIDLAENDHIDISDKNGQYVPQDESNLIYQCAKRVYDECGKPLSGLTIVGRSLKSVNFIPRLTTKGNRSV